MLQLLREQLHQHSIVSAMSISLPQSAEILSDTRTGLSPRSPDEQDETNIGLYPTVVSDEDRIAEPPRYATASLGRSVSARRVRARPPLLHSSSLPSHRDHHRDTGLADMSASSSLATVLMDRMSSLEDRVAEQQRRSEATMTRLLNQVCFQDVFNYLLACLYLSSRDLRSFEIRFELESAVRTADSIRKGMFDFKILQSNRPCLLLCSS